MKEEARDPATRQVERIRRRNGRTSLLEALGEVGMEAGGFILEDDALRILDSPERASFWRSWWERDSGR